MAEHFLNDADVEFRSYARRTPVLTLNSGRVLVSLTLPDKREAPASVAALLEGARRLPADAAPAPAQARRRAV